MQTRCMHAHRSAYIRWSFRKFYLLYQAGNAHFAQQCALNAQVSEDYLCVALIVKMKEINFVSSYAQCAQSYSTAYSRFNIVKNAGNAYSA